MEAVTFVAGYHAETIRIRYPNLPILINPEWETTGSGASLLSVHFERDTPLTACYGDILFRASHVDALARSTMPVAVAWDSSWRRRYSNRSTEDLTRCEKVCVTGERITRLGADLAPNWADGEFVGLVRFSGEALEMLSGVKHDADKGVIDRLRTAHLSGLIEYLRVKGLEIGGVDVAGDWAEVNAPRDIAHFVLGTKAESLHRLRGMVTKSVIQDQVAFSVSEWRNGRGAVLGRVRSKFQGREVVVRSSAQTEDGFESANAGAHTSTLGVNPERGLDEAVDRVVASYGEPGDGDQVLIQPMVANVRLSGVAFTRTLERGAPWYVINYDLSGNTESITSGQSSDHRSLMLRRARAGTKLPDEHLAPIVDAVREIEDLLGYDGLDVEFALEGDGTVHVFQVRPIAFDRSTTGIEDDSCEAALEEAAATWYRLVACPAHIPGNAPPIYGVMPDWNPAEIIGTCPGALAESLYRYLVLDEVWAVQRAEYGYRDVRPAPLLVSFAGKPYVDVRASFASFVPAAVPDELAGRLLGFYLEWLAERPELHDKVEFEVVPTCLAPGFDAWERRFRESGRFSDSDIAALRDGLRDVTNNGVRRYVQDLASLEVLCRRFDAVHADCDPLERARILLEDCRRFGTLPFAHLARSAFVATTLLRGAEEAGVISASAKKSFLSSVRTITHKLTDDARSVAEGALDWDEFMDRYGHLRPGTYEINSMRYDADPEGFLRPLVDQAFAADRETADLEAWHAERKDFLAALAEMGMPAGLEEVEGFLRHSIEGREYAKFLFCRNLSAALEALAEAGEQRGLDRVELSDIPLADLFALRDARHSREEVVGRLRDLSEAGRRARMVTSACELPPLITGIDDLNAFVIGSDRPNFFGGRAVTAECLDLSDADADIGGLEGRIVMIKQADPGYDWLFGQGIAALITQYGGANSHMAIRAVEFGLPAAIGIGEQRFRQIRAAQLLELDPVNQILRVVR